MLSQIESVAVRHVSQNEEVLSSTFLLFKTRYQRKRPYHREHFSMIFTNEHQFGEIKKETKQTYLQ